MLRYPFSLIATWLKLATNFLRLLNNPKKEKKLKPSLFQCSPDRTITNFLFLFLSEMQLAEWWRLMKGWRHCNRCSFKDNILSDSFFAFTFTYIYIYIYIWWACLVAQTVKCPIVSRHTHCFYLLLLALNTFWAVLMSMHIKLFLCVLP